MLPDAHCHLSFIETNLEALDAPVTAVTVSPADYLRAKKRFSELSNVTVALGMHPWWVASEICDEEDIEVFCELCKNECSIGEIGLAFDKKWQGTEEVQLQVFRTLLRSLDDGIFRTLSIHCRQAERELLDALEQTHICETSAVFLHCYTGPCDELHRAIEMGCWFSVSVRMLSSRKGREYAKLLPLDRVVFETDACPNPLVPLPCDSVHLSEGSDDTRPRLHLSHDNWKRQLDEARELLENILERHI